MNRRECLKVTGRGALTVPGRLVVTTCLPVVFIAVMSFHYIPKLLHEILGVAWLLLVLLHLYQNRSWLKNLRQGCWSFGRLLGTVIDSLLILGVLVTILSGLGISNYLLKEVMPLAVQRSIALHQYHVSLPYALLILSGLHWGLHWQGWKRQWQKCMNWSLPKMAGRLLAGTLEDHVAEIDCRAEELLWRLIEEMAEREGVTEHLKAVDQLAWMRRMNSIRTRAEEIVSTTFFSN